MLPSTENTSLNTVEFIPPTFGMYCIPMNDIDIERKKSQNIFEGCNKGKGRSLPAILSGYFWMARIIYDQWCTNYHLY